MDYLRVYIVYISVYLSAEGLEKTYIHFSGNTFLLGTVIVNLGNYIWEI